MCGTHRPTTSAAHFSPAVQQPAWVGYPASGILHHPTVGWIDWHVVLQPVPASHVPSLPLMQLTANCRDQCNRCPPPPPLPPPPPPPPIIITGDHHHRHRRRHHRSELRAHTHHCRQRQAPCDMAVLGQVQPPGKMFPDGIGSSLCRVIGIRTRSASNPARRGMCAHSNSSRKPNPSMRLRVGADGAGRRGAGRQHGI